MSSAEESKATVRHYVKNAVAGMRSGNLAATGDFLTSDATFYDPGQLSSVGTEAQITTFRHDPWRLPKRAS